jgi:uncharacterized protein (TIGR03067 family)
MSATFVLALVLATPLPTEVHERDHERICGEWTAGWVHVTIRSDGTFRCRYPIGIMDVSPEEYGGTFILNPASNPGSVDVSLSDGIVKVKGIYRLDGDELDLLLGKEGKERPKSFSDPETRDIVRLKRVLRLKRARR